MCGRHGVGVGGGCVEDRESGREEDVWKTGSGGWRMCGRQGVEKGGRMCGRQGVGREDVWKTGSGEG